jgi:ankyrin repeat protein
MLPDNPNLDWLRKQAKRRLAELRQDHPAAQLANAQVELAKQYGFSSWRALRAYLEVLTVEGKLFDAARSGNMKRLTALLDTHPEKLRARARPYEWTLLHAAAEKGQLAAVGELLKRGLDVNVREQGDNTCAMHWAAAAGHLDVVRRLADAGGDVVGHGDDHHGDVIGWATCWPDTDDAAHRAVADFLVNRGARHHIFSAVAMNLADEVRRIVAADPSAINRRQSRNENHRTPLHLTAQRNDAAAVSWLLTAPRSTVAGRAAARRSRRSTWRRRAATRKWRTCFWTPAPIRASATAAQRRCRRLGRVLQAAGAGPAPERGFQKVARTFWVRPTARPEGLHQDPPPIRVSRQPEARVAPTAPRAQSSATA